MRRIGLLVYVSVVLALVGCKRTDNGLVEQKEINEGWTFRQAGTGEWLPATVPGCVHTDLMANGKIEDPFYRLNEHDQQWIDKVDWEYRTDIKADRELLRRDRVALDFKGLDTYADVFVNGEQVLSSDNMFREYMVDVKPLLREGDNELRILFRSPINEGLKKREAYLPDSLIVSDNDLAVIGQVEGGKQVGVFSRKAGYHFGWDWGPRLVSSGVWRPVVLTAWDGARIENIQLVTVALDSIQAWMTAQIEVEAECDTNAVMAIVCDGDTLNKVDMVIMKGVHTYPVDFNIDKPELWWTNGLGKQKLYDIEGVLSLGDKSTSVKDRLGLRRLDLVREKDKDGTSFYFMLNGVPVFMKGANYIPNDIFPARVTREQYQNVVNTARESNLNMLRVWGGGLYENDEFYDMCDEAGILVWQDFMFACSMYPGDSAFLENVRCEAIDNVKRLRNHPSVALWCGNNEILTINYKKVKELAKSDPQSASRMWKAYEDLFHKVLPEVVEQYDPQRYYWSSSPSGGEGVLPDLKNSDEHYWGVWWGKKPFSTYATHIGRFMSEYGFQSFPELRTVETYALPEDYDIFSDVMKSHQRSTIGNGTIEYYMLQEYEKPKDFASFLYVGQVLQAEGIKFALEGHRRAMPYCMGSLYWQINDCWPVASWSSTDYLQRWKALQYFVKKGFEPVLVSPYTEDGRFKVNVVNDRLSEVAGGLELKMIGFDGSVVWEQELDVKVPANSSVVVFDVDRESFLKGKDTRSQMLSAVLKDKDGGEMSNVYYFRPVKELELGTPQVKTDVKAVEDGYEITLRSDRLAKNVFLSIGGEEGFFSDNYFDLLPGEDVTVYLKTPVGKERFDEIFSVRTLNDAF